MVVTKNRVVTINYTLKGDHEELIDSSLGTDPLQYIHGTGYLLPKLEEQLEGKTSGSTFHTVLAAKDGYGEYNPKLVAEVSRDNFDTDFKIEVGMQFQAETPQGPQLVTVKKVTDEKITVDANHELAGKNLHFDIEVLDVRDATESELQNGLSQAGCCGSSCEGDCSAGCCGGGCVGSCSNCS